MRKEILIALTVTALAVGFAPGAQANSITKLAVTATGANESGGTGAMSGSSSGTFILNSAKGTLCSTIKTKGLVDVASSHIHKGAKGVDGGVVVTFNTMKFNSASQSCVKVAKALLSQIAMNPSQYYFNVHTKTSPGGAVRGQLAKQK